MQNSSSDAAKTSIATVTLVENMGNENHIYINVGSIKIIIKSDAEIVPKIGDKLKISFEEEEVHLFDLDSKESLKPYHN